MGSLGRVLIVVGSMFMFVACTAYKPPVKRDIVTDRTIGRSFDAVWDRTIEWFAMNNIPIKTIEKASGLIATEYDLRNDIRQSCDCGQSGFGVTVSNEVIGNFNVIVRAVNDSTTKVSVKTFFKTSIREASFSTAVPDQVSASNCESTGYLEKAILDHASR